LRLVQTSEASTSAAMRAVSCLACVLRSITGADWWRLVRLVLTGADRC